MGRGRSDRRGQVGIGTLVVFIAMVLVAAIAAGVLINTAGFLQSQSERTGEQSSERVTERLTVISETGIVGNSQDTDSGREVETLEISVKRAPGAGDIDLREATIDFIGPLGSADLTWADRMAFGSSHFETSAVKGSAPTLSNDGDVIKIQIFFDHDGDAVDVLEAGDSATLDITTRSGGTTRVGIEVPNSLAGEEAVRL